MCLLEIRRPVYQSYEQKQCFKIKLKLGLEEGSGSSVIGLIMRVNLALLIRKDLLAKIMVENEGHNLMKRERFSG